MPACKYGPAVRFPVSDRNSGHLESGQLELVTPNLRELEPDCCVAQTT